MFSVAKYQETIDVESNNLAQDSYNTRIDIRACLKTNVNNKLSISQYFRHLCFGDCLNK